MLFKFQVVKSKTLKSSQQFLHEMIEKLPTGFELLESHLIYNVMLLQLKIVEQAILNSQDFQLQISDLVSIIAKADRIPDAFEIKIYQILKCWLQHNEIDPESSLTVIVQIYPQLFKSDFSQNKLRYDSSDAKRRLIKQFLVTLFAKSSELTQIDGIKIQDILNDILETVIKPSLGHKVKIMTSNQIKKVLQILNSIVFISASNYPAIISKINEES